MEKLHFNKIQTFFAKRRMDKAIKRLHKELNEDLKNE